jgi:hypothetical protein
MKKRKFNTGGYTDQEASDLMLNDILPKRSIRLTSDEPETAQSAADTAAENAALAREMARETRAAAPRAAPRVAPTVRATPDMVSDQISRNAPAPKSVMSSDQPSRNMPTPRVASNPAPSRGSYDMPSPLSPLVEALSTDKGKVTPRPRMVQSETTDGMTSNKPKPKPKPKGMSSSPYKAGGSVKASKRADGIAQRGKTKGRMC